MVNNIQLLVRVSVPKRESDPLFFFRYAVEATAYITAVAVFAAVLLVLLLFLGKKWCYTVAVNRKRCNGILNVNSDVVPGLSLNNAQCGKNLYILAGSRSINK